MVEFIEQRHVAYGRNGLDERYWQDVRGIHMVSEHLAERLKALADCAEQLPPELQEKLAAQIESIIDNAIWDAQLRDPANLEILRELAEEALQGPKLPMPTPFDTGDQGLLDADDLAILTQPEDAERSRTRVPDSGSSFRRFQQMSVPKRTRRMPNSNKIRRILRSTSKLSTRRSSCGLRASTTTIGFLACARAGTSPGSGSVPTESTKS